MSLRKKFSVVIPHRNSPLLLQRCLDAIPQDDRIEVLVVDDCSSDVDKSSFPGNERSDVRVFFMERPVTAGGARNIGVEHANGDWIMFVDADDFVLDGAFDMLYPELKKDLDIIYFKVKSVYSDTLLPANRGDVVNSMVDQGIENEMHLRTQHVVPWGKIFNLDFVKRNSIVFDEVPASNDVMFSVKAGILAEKIAVLNKEIYCVTMTSGSISNTRNIVNNRSRYKVMLRYNQFLRINELGSYQKSIRPFVFEAAKVGVLELFTYIKLMIQYKGNIFFDFNPFRLVKTYLAMKRKDKVNVKYRRQ